MKKTLLNAIALIFVFTLSQPLWAGCESSIIEGGHTALTKKEAKIGAWEDAKDACYPGEATKLNLQCKKVKGDKGVQGKKAIRCDQEVSCNVCADDLMRKYEATY
jgi:hypothetical protein